MTKRSKTLCVISPCYNEEAVVSLFHERLSKVLNSIVDIEHQILLVDDGSSDATLERLNALAQNDAHLRVLSLSRNFGHQIALTAGLDHADADAVLLMDSDLQHPPELIPAMVTAWLTRDADIVSAVRNQTAGVSFFKRATSAGFYALLNLLSETKIETGAADFCLLSRRALEALTSMPERHRFLRGMVSWMGFRRISLPYDAAQRAAGMSKYTLRKMFSFALDAAFSFSTAPVKLATRFGLFVSLLGFLYFAYILMRAIVFGDLVQGWGSLMSVLLILGGFNFALIGLTGGYLGRVYEEVKGRPLYFLKHDSQLRSSAPKTDDDAHFPDRISAES